MDLKMMRNAGISGAATLGILLWISACEAHGRNAQGTWVGTIDTVGGIVVVTNPSHPAWSPDDAWHLAEDLRIGAIDSEGADAFSRIAALEVDEQGRIYVLDQRAREVRVFTADGIPLRTLGASGEGPGEFRNPLALAISRDEALWVVDPGNGRYTVFDSIGQLSSVHRRPIGFFIVPWPGGFDEQGSLYDTILLSDARLSQGRALVRLSPEMQPVDTIPVPRDVTSPITVLRANGTPAISIPDPFASRLVWQFDPRGFIWSAVTDRYEIVQQNLYGDTIRIIRRDAVPVRITEQEADSALDAIRTLIASAGPDSRVNRQPRVPPEKPVLNTFYVDDGGYIWAQPSVSRGEPPVFDVFDPTGRYMGPIKIPVTMEEFPAPVITNGAVYAAVSDSLDIPYVVRLRVFIGGTEEVLP